MEYTFERKEKLAKQIQKLKKQQYFLDIKNIIVKYNPEIIITTNQSGHFLYFQNLKTETYFAIEKYIRKNITKQIIINNDNNDNNDKVIKSDKIANNITHIFVKKNIIRDNTQDNDTALTLS
jgi:hypothetical protein